MRRGVAKTYEEAVIGFNSLLEMPDEYRRQEHRRHSQRQFQFSIGDAVRTYNPVMRREYIVSILYWRCHTADLKFNVAASTNMVSILYWRCAFPASIVMRVLKR